MADERSITKALCGFGNMRAFGVQTVCSRAVNAPELNPAWIPDRLLGVAFAQERRSWQIMAAASIKRRST
jgi:hypothetical protein